MEMHFVGRNIEVTPALKSFTEEKLTALEKRFKLITHIHVILQIVKTTQKAEATIHVSGAEIFAEAESDDMYKSIELLVDKLLAQLTKHKEKLTEHR